MRAMVLTRPRTPLAARRVAAPVPGPGEVRIRIAACGVCRTDLHLLDGDLEPPLPRVPGHEVVGVVEAVGDGVTSPRPGERVGAAWLAHACGRCALCASGRENLCPDARFTGFHRDGGYAERMVAEAAFVFPLSDALGDAAQVAPLLCAGLIGHRALRLAGDGVRIGLYGFGAAAHILAQVLAHQGRRTYAFTRPGDVAAQRFARRLGAVWAGGSDQSPPEPLDAAIVFAPVGELVPRALAATAPGGRVVLGGIHMSDIPPLPYRLLWQERSVQSVANLTRADGQAFLALAARVPIRTEVVPYPLEAANDALADLRAGRLEGAAVLLP